MGKTSTQVKAQAAVQAEALAETQPEKLAEKLAIIEEHGGSQENILDILLALQAASEDGYIDRQTTTIVAKRLAMPETKVFEVASFYAMLKTSAQAKYVFQVCNSTPCFFSKADEVAAWLGDTLGVNIGEVTSDGLFSYVYTPCVGACEIGPVIKIQDTVYGDLTEAKVKGLIEDIKSGKLS